MGSCWAVKYPLYSFWLQSSLNLVIIQVLYGFSHLPFSAHKVCAIIRAHDSDLTSFAYKTLNSINAGVSISSEGEAGEHHAVSLDCTAAPFDIKWPKVINACVREKRFVGHKAVFK